MDPAISVLDKHLTILLEDKNSDDIHFETLLKATCPFVRLLLTESGR